MANEHQGDLPLYLFRLGSSQSSKIDVVRNSDIEGLDFLSMQGRRLQGAHRWRRPGALAQGRPGRRHLRDSVAAIAARMAPLDDDSAAYDALQDSKNDREMPIAGFEDRIADLDNRPVR